MLRRAREMLPVAEATRAAAAARASRSDPTPAPTSKGRERGGSARPGGGSGPSAPRGNSTSKGIASKPVSGTSKPVSSSVPAPSKRPEDDGIDVHMTDEEYRSYRRVLGWALRESERQQIDADRASLGRTGHLPEQRFARETRGSRR